jgi:hypothetical protein
MVPCRSVATDRVAGVSLNFSSDERLFGPIEFRSLLVFNLAIVIFDSYLLLHKAFERAILGSN